MMRSQKGSLLWQGMIIPAGLLILNLILRMIFLDSRDLAMDEPFTVFYSQADLHTIFRMLATENNPPLYFLILHCWIKIFGISVFSVRFLSCIFSSLLVWVIWQTGQKFFNVRVGLIASLLSTVSNYEMIFAHEARVYALFALLSSLSFFFFLSVIRDPVRKKYWILLAVANVLLVYSHFFGFMVILAQGVCLASSRETWKNAGRFLLTVVITLVAFSPYIPVTISRFSASSGGTWIPAPVLSDLYTMAWRFSNAPVVTVLFILILAAAGILGLIRVFKSRTRVDIQGKIIILWFFFPYLFLFFISFRLPVFLDRYLVFVTPAWFLMIAMAMDRLDYKKWTSYTLASVAVIAMAVTFRPDADNKRRIRETVGVVEAMRKPRMPVIICPEWLKYGFAYYYDRQAFEDYRNLDARLNGEGIYPVNGPDGLDPGIFKRPDGIIYFEEWATLVDKDNRILKTLQENYPVVRLWKGYESYSVYCFSK